MTSTAEQLALLKTARKAGIRDLSSLNDRQFKKLSLASRRGIGAKAEAVRAATASAVRTRVLKLTILEPIYRENAGICESNTCGMFQRLDDEAIACTGCGCSGKLLASKQKDPKQRCPVGLWDNRGKPTVKNPRFRDVDLDAAEQSVRIHSE